MYGAGALVRRLSREASVHSVAEFTRRPRSCCLEIFHRYAHRALLRDTGVQRTASTLGILPRHAQPILYGRVPVSKAPKGVRK